MRVCEREGGGENGNMKEEGEREKERGREGREGATYLSESMCISLRSWSNALLGTFLPPFCPHKESHSEPGAH